MKVEVNGKIYCVETLIADNERLRKDVIASAEYHRLVLDKIRAEIQENINYNKKMNYQGILAGLLLALDIITNTETRWANEMS